MDNTIEINPFESDTEMTSFGRVTRLQAEEGVSVQDSISFEGKSLMAIYDYKDNGTYDLVYTVVDGEGGTKSFLEPDGKLPTFFAGPNGDAHVSIVLHDPDKELEISIPVFNRERIERPKGNRPFVGKFIGTCNQFAIFYDVDPFSPSKPDKLQGIEFKNGVIRKKHNSKISVPGNNKIFIGNNEIHLLARMGEGYVQRQIDESGKEIRQRSIAARPKVFKEALSMSFDQYAYLLSQEGGMIAIEKIDAEGKGEVVELIDIGDPFYSTWKPVEISANTFVTRFTTEWGNGWLTTKEDKLIEIYYGKGDEGYKNLITGESLKLGNGKYIISGINKTGDDSYAVIFYPFTDRNTKNREVVILNHSVG